MEKSRAENTVHNHGGREHDSEDVSRRGMSTDAAAVDEAETMASTGDSENAFQGIAAGTATGWGIDFYRVRFLLFGFLTKGGSTPWMIKDEASTRIRMPIAIR